MKKFFLVFWVLLGFLLLFYWVYLPALSKYQDLKMKEEEMQSEIDSLNAQIALLTKERSRLLNDPEYVESVIRNELGLVKRGEVVYKFVPESEEPKPADPSQDLSKNLTVSPK